MKHSQTYVPYDDLGRVVPDGQERKESEMKFTHICTCCDEPVGVGPDGVFTDKEGHAHGSLGKEDRVGVVVKAKPGANTKPTNPKDRAATDRVDLSLFPDTAVVYGALALTEGDLKYGAYNWRVMGIRASVYVAACRRHLAKWNNGSDKDPATQVHHLGNALACIALLIDAIVKGNLVDDRPPAVDMEKLLDESRATVKHLQEMYPTGPERYTQVKHGDSNG